MHIGRVVICLLWWTLPCSRVVGRIDEVPLAVRGLVQRADSLAKTEYCGAVSAAGVDHYLFVLERKELTGMVLVQQRIGTAPVIIDADTSLFPFRNDRERPLEVPVQNAIKLLLQKRNRVKRRPEEVGASNLDFEVSAVGSDIDHVIYPISGFRLDSNSTREILRLLRTGPALAVDPRTAPPGSIIVSPTQASPYGTISLGHAGIVGSNGSIYSADARYKGARTKNFSITRWLREFSTTNGSYAFVLHAPSRSNVRGI